MRVYTCFTLGEINLVHTIFTLCAYNFNFMRSEFLRCAYIIFLLCVYILPHCRSNNPANGFVFVIFA
jgi:hypothetical protein